MSDGTIKIDLEVDSKNAKSQAKTTGDAIGKQVSTGVQSGTKDAGSKAGYSITKGITSSTKGTGDAVGNQIGGGLKSSLSSAASEASSALSGSFSRASGVASSALSTIGSAAATMGAAVASVAVAAGVGVAAIGKQALDAYATYEQAVGGVETLFKDSAPVVEGYAEDAYKTAGLSSNEYMSTVTSFSASMISSLGGDTAAAAEMSNQAITDMSDNANRMGTDMSSIQMTYQSIARGNYGINLHFDNVKKSAA